ncbi:MAG TPA: uroporphyrinogen decarboxylase family protein [Phycisphaerae bacterium]|nr:uroporphyrinogen decarboxylase family protein [Phycisphaerae bacterium]
MTRRQTKIARIIAALEHHESDRVPIGEFFWTNFIRRAKREKQLPDTFDPYRHWDLDMIVINPNMDPHLTGIQVREKSNERTVVETGFGATIELRGSCPMPMYRDFATVTCEQMAAFRFDDSADERRYTARLDDQINSIGDTLNLGLPSYVERVNAYAGDFCVFGSVCEPHEMLWRIIGTENALLKIAEEPAKVAAFIDKLGDFLVGIVKAQVDIVGDKLTGMYVWGDIAYVKGMFFSPDYWRRVYKPQLKRICDAIHAAGLKAIYHGCGNASAVYDDMIEAGVDAYNPLEAKAGLNVVDLKRRFANRWAFNGNIDVRVLATNDREQIRREVLTKLNAAKGGGYIFQSDHSVPDNVDFDSYDYAVRLVREHGRYPLQLGEFDRQI